jgi:Fe2+ transport system protein B
MNYSNDQNYQIEKTKNNTENQERKDYSIKNTENQEKKDYSIKNREGSDLNKKTSKKKRSRFKKIPKEFLSTPGGVLLIFTALIMELLDLIPIPPPFDQIIEIPLEMFFMVLLKFVVGMPVKSMIIPFIVERVPGLGDFLPTWIIRIFL